jgi:glycosyltransferase involved in cell wall biosynthesis
MSSEAVAGRRHIVVMVATSYPRFPGDNVGSFMEPIAHGVAARGHQVHLVAPWHPAVARPEREGDVHFHFFRYAPAEALSVFGYAGALRADVSLRPAAYAVAPLALLAGARMARRVARQADATVVHGHWVIPGGAIAMLAATGLPLVISLHGSDVYVAERSAVAARVARAVFARAGWVTACSDDLLARARTLGARAEASEVVPYGVDPVRFRPDPAARAAVRARFGVGADAPLVFAAGRFVRKKGFEYLVQAMAHVVRRRPDVTLLLAGSGDLEGEYRALASSVGAAERMLWPGLLSQDEVAACLAAADVAVVPSVRDAAGNVDGLPNVVLEAMASGTPLVTTPAGGIGRVATDGETALVVPEGDVESLGRAIEALLVDADLRRHLGSRAHALVEQRHAWDGVAARFEAAYDHAAALPR